MSIKSILFLLVLILSHNRQTASNLPSQKKKGKESSEKTKYNGILKIIAKWTYEIPLSTKIKEICKNHKKALKITEKANVSYASTN